MITIILYDDIGVFNISIRNIDCRYINTFFENINIDKVIPENIDIDKIILDNIDR